MRSITGRARGISLATLLLIPILPVRGQAQVTPTPPQQREHIVKAGETLWQLAQIYFNNPYLWPLIYEANRQIVENPHRIFPTERLIIPPLPGETQAPPTTTPRPPVTEQPVGATMRTRFYTPPDTTTLPTLIMAETAPVRRVEPREYYATPWLQDTATIRTFGQIFRSGDPRAERDKLQTTFHPFDVAYMTYSSPTRPAVGSLMLVIAIGRKMDPYGHVVLPMGVIRVDSLKEFTMVGMVTHQFGPMQTGNYLIPMDSFPSLYDTPVSVSDGPEGELIEFELPQPLIGLADRAFLSLGGNAGVKVGDEFAALLPRRRPDTNRAEALPPRPIARMIVTRVMPNTATARIVHLEEAALRPGLPVRLIRRMP